MHQHDDITSQSQLLKIPQVCKLLQVCRKTLWTQTQQGLIPHYKIGAAVRYKSADIEVAMEQFLAGGKKLRAGKGR